MALVAAGGAALMAEQVWKDKPIAEWTAEEARQVLTESPWAKTVTPSPGGSGGAGQQRAGMSAGGMGIGGMGMGRRGGRGGGGRGSNDTGSADAGPMPVLTLRWASAMPAIAAELIAREANAPTVDEGHYAIAVYGVPGRMIHGDPNSLGGELKKRAAIKREGKKDMKPSSVEVLMHDEGPVILYLFPRSTEITRQDKQLEFNAEIGRLKLAQSFIPGEMVYLGKLEL
jgi:hypothetical protein